MFPAHTLSDVLEKQYGVCQEILHHVLSAQTLVSPSDVLFGYIWGVLRMFLAKKTILGIEASGRRAHPPLSAYSQTLHSTPLHSVLGAI